MPSSVVDAYPGSTRNAVESKVFCAVLLISADCLGKASPIYGRLVKEVLVDDKKVEAVPEFCFSGCSHALQIGFGQVPPTTLSLSLHTNSNLPRLTRGRVYSTYVLPHAAETWAMTGYTLSPAAQ